MSVLELIEKLKKEKINIGLQGTNLKISASQSSLTEQLVEQIKENKQELIGFLSKAALLAEESIGKAPESEFYEVSYTQRRLYILDQVSDNKVAYNIFYGGFLKGTIDQAVLKASVDRLVRRHEILRTGFHLLDSGLYQQITPFRPGLCDPTFIDLSSDSDSNEATEALISRENGYTFDLAKTPLLRLVVAKTSEHRSLVLITMHHIISDQWSGEIFFRELIRSYQHLLAGSIEEEQPLRIQYKDFSWWQNRMLEKNDSDVHRKYWLGQLSGQLPLLEIPADYPRPMVKQYNGSTHSEWLEPAALVSLQEMAREGGCSLFTVLLATVKVLIYRYTGDEELIFGVPVAGRDHRDLQDQLGCYINTLAIRTRFTGGTSFMQLLATVKTNLMEGYQHQVFPFDLLVEELHLQGDRSRSPLFDVSVNYDPGSMDVPSEEASTEDVRNPPISKFDLAFFFTPFSRPRPYIHQLRYRSLLFKKDRKGTRTLFYFAPIHSE